MLYFKASENGLIETNFFNEASNEDHVFFTTDTMNKQKVHLFIEASVDSDRYADCVGSADRAVLIAYTDFIRIGLFKGESLLDYSDHNKVDVSNFADIASALDSALGLSVHMHDRVLINDIPATVDMRQGMQAYLGGNADTEQFSYLSHGEPLPMDFQTVHEAYGQSVEQSAHDAGVSPSTYQSWLDCKDDSQFGSNEKARAQWKLFVQNLDAKRLGYSSLHDLFAKNPAYKAKASEVGSPLKSISSCLNEDAILANLNNEKYAQSLGFTDVEDLIVNTKPMLGM